MLHQEVDRDRIVQHAARPRVCDALLQVVSSAPQLAGVRFGSGSEVPALRRLGLLPKVFATVNALAAGIWSCHSNAPDAN